MATLKDDNDVERFARIDALMEEYRIRHEDLEAYLQKVRADANVRREENKHALQDVRDRFDHLKRRIPR